ncbi:MAG: long-chain fatty acid--CoA ligase [Gemmatimonadota bacterium]|jgi:long-chain acyl-CoA synthetase
MPDSAPPPIREAARPFEYGPGTLVDVFLHGLELNPARKALTSRHDNGTWRSLTAGEAAERVRNISRFLLAGDLEPGDHVAILSNTRMEWALADWACIMSGLVVVTVYPTLPADQVHYILKDSGAKAVFVEDGDQLAKVLQVHDRLEHLSGVFVIDPPEDDEVVDHAGLQVRSLDQIERAGRSGSGPDDGWADAAAAVRPEDTATLIYTSGTTAQPKGVMLSHHNLFTNTIAATMVLPITEKDKVLSWLPLSHAFERLAGHYLMWYSGAEIAYAGSVTTVARDMVETGPTFVVGVPRLYEKFYDAVMTSVQEGGAAKKIVFRAAKWVGDRRAERRLARKPVGRVLEGAYGVADRLVFRKLHERTGGRVRFFVSGAAPLSAEIARFFYAGGLVVLEGYGLTETSPVTNVNPPDDIRFGSVGPPVAGTEIRIADDGEILIRGPQIMQGYFGRPEATREAISEDGWFHTGDIGELDGDGYLRITDRKKNILVTAAGKNIAPQPIEELIARSPCVEQVVLLGDRRKFPLALVVPSFQAYRTAFPGRPISESDMEELEQDPNLQRLMDEEVLSRVSSCARHERPKRILLTGTQFTVEGGELTPTLKVKRRVIEQRYADRIEEVYRLVEEEAEPCA